MRKYSGLFIRQSGKFLVSFIRSSFLRYFRKAENAISRLDMSTWHLLEEDNSCMREWCYYYEDCLLRMTATKQLPCRNLFDFIPVKFHKILFNNFLRNLFDFIPVEFYKVFFNKFHRIFLISYLLNSIRFYSISFIHEYKW